MSLSKDALIERLHQLHIAAETTDHAAVATCDAQAEALASVEGRVTKSLFLKDKKDRLYLVCALADTKVDLKVLSSRLGLGKNVVRMAPDDLLPTVLQVSPGSVTPLALVQPSASHVVLLLDEKMQHCDKLFFHPLTNTATTILSPADLDTFLRSISRTPAYVDLEANPKIDLQHPPDLKLFADSAQPDTNAAEAASPAEAIVHKASEPAAAAGKGQKGSKKQGQQHEPQCIERRLDDTVALAQQLLSKFQTAAKAGELDAQRLQTLQADLEMELNALRNVSYARGFKAGQGAILLSAQRS